MNNRLADQLQIWGFEGDFIIFSDSSLGFALDATPVDVSCWSSERINSLAQKTGQFLNGLHPGVSLQFVQEIGYGSRNRIVAHSELGNAATNEIAQTLCQERAERLGTLEAQGNIPAHNLKIFVRRQMSGMLLDKPGIFSQTKLFQPLAEDKLTREITLITQMREDLRQSLKSLGLETTVLKAETIADLIYWQWNPGRQVPRGAYDPEDVRSSLLFTDTAVYEKGFLLSDVHHRVISLKLLPDNTFASMATALGNLPFDSKLFFTVSVPEQQKELASLQTQRRLAFSMARGKKTGVSDIESEAKLQDLESLIEEMVAQGEKVFHVSMNVLLRSKDPIELEGQVSQTLMTLRELAGAEGMEEGLAAFDIFSSISLPNARATERKKRMKTSNLSDLLPIYGPWPGHPTQSILLRSRMGSLVSFDPFHKELTNYNQIVSGGSGSGKSFLTNILLLQMLKENPRIFIVDIGGSYKKLCDNLSGQYIPLGVDNGLTLNPFDLAPGETTPSSHKIKFLLGLVELMTKEDDKVRLPRLERAEIEEAIQKLYDTNPSPSLSHLRERLLNHPSTEIKRFGRILTPWCGDTPFGRFVDRKTTIELNRPVVAFDLKGLESYPDLQALALFIITDFVWREVQRDRASKKFLVFDECWKLLESDAGSTFIAEVFRTFRKYYASAIAISQNMDDFAKSKVAGAILSNSSVKWVLMQKGADQDRLKEVLQLNENEAALIASLHQERGRYSEAFLIAQDDRSVVAIESLPMEYWIATTDPRDLALFDKTTKEMPAATQLEVLKELSSKYPTGVAGSRGAQ